MTKKELAIKALGKVEDAEFDMLASDGEDGGWCENIPLELSKGELLYLIRKRFPRNDIFEGMELEPYDEEDEIREATKEAAWPDGGPKATVNDVVPEELSELFEELENTDMTNPSAVESARCRLREVNSGDYTFSFSVMTDSFQFAEDEEEEIFLTAKEVLGLLRGICTHQELFDGICDESYDEELLNGKAEDLGVAEENDYFDYTDDCQYLETYLESWKYLLTGIFDGTITEDKLDDWLEYFDDSDNLDFEIADWYSYEKE